jgi:hypothetical protein
LKNDHTLTNKRVSICHSNGLASFTINKTTHRTNWIVFEIKFSVDSTLIFYYAKINMNQDNRIDVNKFHEMMGNCGVDKLQNLAKIYGLDLTG